MDANDIEKKKILQELTETVRRHTEKFALLRRFCTLIEGATLAQPKVQVTPVDLQKIFPNFETIASFHQHAILPGLQQCLANWDTTPRIGHLIKPLAPWSKAYVEYIPKYDGAVRHLDKLKARSPKFATMLSEIESKSEFGSLTLKDHLLGPLHHLTRYNTLLERYSKYCCGQDEEHADVVETIHAMNDTLAQCEKNIKHNNEFRELCKIQEQVDKPDIAIPYRQFLHRGDITEIEATLEAKSVPRHLIVCNDIILLCQGANSPGHKLTVKDTIETEWMKLSSANHLRSTGYDPRLVVHLLMTRRTLTFLCNSKAKKTEWEKVLTSLTACGDSIEDVEPFRQAPTVMPASAAEGKCMLCEDKFATLTKKKTSCEGCGQVVCSNCVTHKLPLFYANYRPCRVCMRCFVHGKEKVMKRSDSITSRTSATVVLDKGASASHLPPTRSRSCTGPSKTMSGLTAPRVYHYCLWPHPARTLHEWTSEKSPSALLGAAKEREGAYIVQSDDKNPTDYILHVKHNGKIMQFKANLKDGTYGSNESQRFHTMSDAVDFYRKKPIANGDEGKVFLLYAVTEKENTRI